MQEPWLQNIRGKTVASSPASMLGMGTPSTGSSMSGVSLTPAPHHFTDSVYFRHSLLSNQSVKSSRSTTSSTSSIESSLVNVETVMEKSSKLTLLANELANVRQPQVPHPTGS